MLKLDTDINLSVADFFHWWGGELLSFLPENFRQLLVQRHQFLIAQPDGDNIILSWVERSKVLPMGSFSIDTAGKLSFQELFRTQPDLAELDLILRLPRQDAVSKQIFLPVVAAENLDQVVAYELDRFTPFKCDSIYFAVKPETHEQGADQIKATLIVIPKKKLDVYFSGLSDWGMPPLVVDYESVTNKIDKRSNQYNLLPESQRIKKKRTAEFIMYALLAVTTILMILVMIVPVWGEYQTVEMLSAQIDGVEKDVKTIDGFKIEIDDLYNEATELVDKKTYQPSALAIINSISELITDDSWLTHFKYNNGEIQIQGQAPTASSLIGILESLSLLENTHFVSPVTQDKKTGLERFQIAATVIQRGTNE